jgi:hypothetical protein
MDDVIDVARGEVLGHAHQRVEHVLLEVLCIPMLDVRSDRAHGHPVRGDSIEVVGGRFDDRRIQQADALAPAERTFRIAHLPFSARLRIVLGKCDDLTPQLATIADISFGAACSSDIALRTPLARRRSQPDGLLFSPAAPPANNNSIETARKGHFRFPISWA